MVQHIAAGDSVRLKPYGVATLSRREIQVLQQIAKGLAMSDIAALLSLSGKTIAHHRRQLLAKLEVHNDVQLAGVARDLGLTDIDTPVGA